MIWKQTFCLTITVCVLTIHTFAQREGNIWCFPDHAGIDFNNQSNPTPFMSSIGTHANLNQATIANSNGGLFCYTAAIDFSLQGLYIFGSNNIVMPNGSQLHGHPNAASLLLPQPGIDSLICLFHIGRDPINTNNFWLFYSRINKNLNSGFGDVSLRDSAIYYGPLSDEKLAVVKHANGRDWWIFIYDRVLGFVSYLLTPSGISQSNIQQIGSNGDSLFYGKLIFSNDGAKLMSVGAFGQIDVFDFNRCSGLLGNFRDIGEHLTTDPYQYLSAAFSPNGNVIYVSPFNLTKNFYQFDLNAPNITASKILLNSYADTGMVQWKTYNWHNLGPDGKIYIPLVSNYQGPNQNNIFTQYLDVIENPDVVGVGCNYVRQGFYLGGHYAAACLPNMPYYGLGAMTGSICDSLITTTQNTSVQSPRMDVFPNPSKGIFNVQLSDKNDRIISLKLENLYGENIFLMNHSSTIDLTDYSTGFYFLKAVTEKKKMFTKKLIKE